MEVRFQFQYHYSKLNYDMHKASLKPEYIFDRERKIVQIKLYLTKKIILFEKLVYCSTIERLVKYYFKFKS